MIMHVKTLGCKIIRLELELSDTFSVVKSKIQESMRKRVSRLDHSEIRKDNNRQMSGAVWLFAKSAMET